MATLPLWKLFSYAAPASDFYVNPACDLSPDIGKLGTVLFFVELKY